MRPVIVCTEHKGVFFGYTEDASSKEKIVLANARMAIYWGTSRGVMQLAHTGPTASSKISDPAPKVTLWDITAVFEVTSEAEQAWKDAK